MRVAILHYHLRPGGVTRVIEMAWAALHERGLDVLVITGEPAPENSRIPASSIQVVPELCYGVSARESDLLRAEVEAAELRHWGHLAEVLHFHNHALGKNFALPLAIAKWAEMGRRLLLQIHDFAENGRPANYWRLLEELGGTDGLGRCLYPVASQVGYAVLTTSDASRLQEGGLKEGARLLPNPVSLPVESQPIPRQAFHADRLIVYPTRAIRRKNIGEALLWAAWAAPGEQVLLTAAPEQGPDVARHADWRSFAEELGLPIVFEAQKRFGRSTADFLMTADVCLTTSVAEGFGMAFLEPWLAGSCLAGRDLPAVTADFRHAGVVLDGVYARMDVAAEGVSKLALLEDIEGNIRASCAAYGVAYVKDFRDSAFASVWRNGLVDFGRLGEAHQRAVIQTVWEGGEKQSLPDTSHQTETNRATILQEFSLTKYAERLTHIYRDLADQKPVEPSFLNPRGVLAANLSFDDYFSVRNV